MVRLPPGLYDQPVTLDLRRGLEKVAEELRHLEALDGDDAPEALARLLHQRIVHALSSVKGRDLGRQIALANQIFSLLEKETPDSGVDPGDHVAHPAERLLGILEEVAPPAVARRPVRPGISVATSDLLVNGRHDLSLGPEVKRELASADRVDLLCSFLKWSGFRLVEDDLRDLLVRRPGSLRVLTTAYMQATERRALDALVELGAQVKVSYNTTRTRLHAKAWLFHRESGYSTAAIGSSNLSAAAMLDGLEWNVRLSAVDNGPILEKFGATFEQYWADIEFRAYVPAEFDEAVERGIRSHTAPLLRFEVDPRPHQQEILDDLAAERARGHHRNLVVAATGTGKTIVAALDYRRLQATHPRLLFVAHRREILEQSQATFQVILRDGAFGEQLYDGRQPVRWQHVFASIQSLGKDVLARIPANAFDMVIVDEFHHAAAKTYKELLAHLAPKVLLGLTATPERTDGQSILPWFDGRVASELRLWKALDQGLLCSFQYFGIGGAPDASGVKWSGGRYDEKALSNLYTADHLFAIRIIQELQRKVSDVARLRGLVFCVDIAHAEFMAGQFRKAGLSAAAVSSRTSAGDRDARLAELRAGQLQLLCSVDLFNEGVDLPDVNTVLFLRPTESATVFLQQLGRGLRLTRDKECLTVLDFIGHAHRKFRFDLRYRAIVGGTMRGVQRAIEEGFPSLPSGCTIQLDRASQESVLANIRQAVGQGRSGLIEDLRQVGDVPLAAFLAAAGIELEDVYAGDWSWSELRRRAGLDATPRADGDLPYERAFARLLHVDDGPRLDGFSSLLATSRAPAGDPASDVQRMLFALLGRDGPVGKIGQTWADLWRRPHLLEELRQIVAVLGDRSRRLTRALPRVPLRVHATYSLDEIMAALDERDAKDGLKRIQTGAVHLARLRTDLFFVTLEKSAKHYTPTTMYRDYPMTQARFHWESQSSCHQDTPAGRRYVSLAPGRPDDALLFVRARRQDERGVTSPYTLLGRCFYRTHRGGKPMQIEWDLEHPMPPALFQETKVAAG
jgi:superfamily II DNA or RNA helicase/HKD family nuclease